MTDTLLVELFTEELPPKALSRLATSFADTLLAGLLAKKLAPADAVATVYASPRRLAVSIPAVLARAADESAEEKIMPVSLAAYQLYQHYRHVSLEGNPAPP